jgi:hypothetical protein
MRLALRFGAALPQSRSPPHCDKMRAPGEASVLHSDGAHFIRHFSPLRAGWGANLQHFARLFGVR